jgi:SAM-dependent methyltransferase
MPKNAADTTNLSRRTVETLRGADWYDHPRWYDVLHRPGTAAEARGLVRIAREHTSAPASGPIRFFEPACGTARHLRHLARMNHHTTGLDLAKPMLDYAANRCEANSLGVNLHHADMTSFTPSDVGVRARKTTGFHLAFCLANSVRHLPTDKHLAEHLRRVAQTLAPGGLYAVGIGLTEYGVEQESEDIWKGAQGSLRVTQMVQYLPAEPRDRRERVLSQLAVNTPTRETYVEHNYDLRSYNAAEWAAAVRAAGLRVLRVVDEDGDTIFGPPDRTPRLNGAPALDNTNAWRDGWLGYGVFLLAPA